MFVKKESGVIVGSWSSPQNHARRERDPDQLLDDRRDAVARPACPAPTPPPPNPNWKVHDIPNIDRKLQPVLGLIGAVGDPTNQELVMSAFQRSGPLPRNGATRIGFLTYPTVGYDGADIDDLFERRNVLRIHPDHR